MSKPRPTRQIHFVGTYPSDTDEDAMLEMLKLAGPYVASLPSGETRRPNWIIEDLQLLESDPDVVVTKEGDYVTYDRMAQFQVKEGQTLNPDNIKLTYHDYTQANWPTFAKLRKKYKRPSLPYQVNVPGTLEVPMFAFGQINPLNGFRNRKPFQQALQREVDLIVNDPTIGEASKNSELIWQIEIPAEVGGMDKAPDFLQALSNPLAARALAKGVVQQVAALPKGAKVIIHACNGDLKHEGFSTPKSSELIAALAKAIIKQWPEGRTLAGLHFPFASGDHAPSLDPAYYRPLQKLADILPRGTRFIAGFVHEDASFEDQKAVRDMIEDNLARHVDIAYFCGYGRISHKAAQALTKKSITLAV